MSDTAVSLTREIGSAGELQSVVRMMKAVAASSVGQYERSVAALDDYYRNVQLGLSVCLRERGSSSLEEPTTEEDDSVPIGVIVFGSDQGLVGQFNEIVVDYVLSHFPQQRGTLRIWAVGERLHGRLIDAGITPIGSFHLPTSVAGIAQLVGQIQIESEIRRTAGAYATLHVIHNRPLTGSLFEPVIQRLLPLDARWQRELANIPWPTRIAPQIIDGPIASLHTLIREYLFISLFRACAESLESENASRLSAMQRADKNISELVDRLRATFHRLRQGGIDDELFDVLAGFEAITDGQSPR